MGKVYTCIIDGVYGPVEESVDTDDSTFAGQTLSCWLPSAGEDSSNARNVTFGAAGVDPEPPAVSVGGVSAQQVADFLGQGDVPETLALAGAQLPFVLATVEAYTRGRGFVAGEPGPDVALVVIASTARLVSNPDLKRSEKIGDYEVTPGAFLGWTLPELAILHRYRRRAA